MLRAVDRSLSVDVRFLHLSSRGLCLADQCSTRSVRSSPRSEPNWTTFRGPVNCEDQNWQSLRRDELDRLQSNAVNHVRG
jgi:hypothetical protein